MSAPIAVTIVTGGMRGLTGPPGPQGPGGVASVNGHSGPAVTLTAADVGADAAGLAATESARAVAAEGALATSVTAEVGRAETAEGVNAAAVTAETTRATAAEAANASAISTEATTRATADTANASATAAEVTRATAAEATKATTTALTTETTRATTAEGVNATAIAAETTRATAAEALLAPKASPALTGTPTAPTQAALDNSTKLSTTAYSDAATAVEKARALAAEGVNTAAITANTTAITAEASTARANEATKAAASALTAEITRATAAEGTNATAIVTETTRATAAEATKAQNLVDTAVLTGAQTAAVGQRVRVDISGGNAPVQLPTAPADGTRCALKVVAVNAIPGTYTATFVRGGSDVFNKPGGSTTLTFTALFSGCTLRYHAADSTWAVENADAALGSPLGAGKLGTDGTLGGPSGSPLTASVVTASPVAASVNLGATGNFDLQSYGRPTGQFTLTANSVLTLQNIKSGAVARLHILQPASGTTFTLSVTDGTNTVPISDLDLGNSKCTIVEIVALANGAIASAYALASYIVPSAPGQPTALTANALNGQVSLSWTAPSNGGSPITDTVVQYRVHPAGGWTTFAHGALGLATAIAVTGLTNGTQYDFQVASVNAIGTGAFSATATATPSASLPIAHAIAQSTTSTVGPTTSAINTTGATLIVVAAGNYAGTGGSVTLTDSAGNTWTALTSYAGTNANLRLYYCLSPTTNAAHTFHLTDTGAAYATIAVIAMSGTLSVKEIDTGAYSTSTTAIQPGTATPSVNGELIFTAICHNATTSLAVDSGFTITDQVAHAASGEGLAFAYLVQTTAAAINPTWSGTLGSSGQACAMASFH